MVTDMMNLNELAIKTTDEDIEQLHRGVQVLVEKIDQEGNEVAVITGLPRRHPDVGRLVLMFRRSNGVLDTIFLGSSNNVEIGRKQIEADAEKMVEQIQKACNVSMSKSALVQIARNYLSNLAANNFPEEIASKVMKTFPMEILKELKSRGNGK